MFLLFRHSVVSSSLWYRELEHARPPCPPPSPGACSNSCPLSQRCHATISSSVVPFSSCPQSFPELRSFPMSCSSHQVVKYWSFSFSTSSFNEYSRLISFRTDWFDLLAVQETLKSLFQHHSLKASIFQHSAFFTVQLSHPYMTTGEKKKFRQCWPLSANRCFCLIRRHGSWRKKKPFGPCWDQFHVSFKSVYFDSLLSIL